MLAIVEYAIIICLPNGGETKKRRLNDEGKLSTTNISCTVSLHLYIHWVFVTYYLSFYILHYSNYGTISINKD